MTDDERKLAELAVLNRDLREQQAEARKEIKRLVAKVELPVIVALNGNAVAINKPPYTGAMPQIKVARCVHD